MVHLEFHCHTIYSKDSLVRPERLLQACQRKGIDRVVITDHNTIAGAVHAHRFEPQMVIIGEEIMTTQGELLAAYVQEGIPAGLEPGEAIERLKRQGAFISVSHPFDAWRGGSWALPALLEIIPLIDAIETFNSRCIQPGANRRALEFAWQHGLQGTVGSDAHTPLELGRATMLLPEFHEAGDLKQALLHVETHCSASPIWIHLFSRYAAWYKRIRRANTSGSEN